MITEIVLLLGILGFLAIRNDYVARKGPFVMAMLFWGIARILTEITFKTDGFSGKLRYEWGSLSACAAAASLFLCLFCVFWACLRPAGKRRVTSCPEKVCLKNEATDEPVKNASERIKELVGEDQEN